MSVKYNAYLSIDMKVFDFCKRSMHWEKLIPMLLVSLVREKRTILTSLDQVWKTLYIILSFTFYGDSYWALLHRNLYLIVLVLLTLTFSWVIMKEKEQMSCKCSDSNQGPHFEHHVYSELLRFDVWLASHVAINFVPIMVWISVELAFQKLLVILPQVS